MKNLQRLGALLLIIGAVFLGYWPAQRNGFVWDDTALILRDPLIRSWRLIPEAFQHFLFIDATASNFYRPLQRLSFMADYAIWDRNSSGYHLSSIYVHIGAAFALFLLVEKLLAAVPYRRAYALGVALLWAVHPLHTSAVTYIAGRADPLAALFGFSAITLGLLTFERTGRRAILAMTGASVCFLAALLSKESGVFALIVWLLILIWRKESRAVFMRWGLAAALILTSYTAIRLSAEKVPPPKSISSAVQTPAPILAARALGDYARLFVAPENLHMERDVSTRAASPGNESPDNRFKTGLGFLVAAGLCGWGWWAKRRAPVAGLALLAFAAAYLPISNLIPLNATIAEHWLYVPSAFLLLAGAATVAELFKKRGWLVLIPLSAWAIYLGISTNAQQGYWLKQRVFVLRTIEAGGDSARMRVNLGNIEAGDGHPELAIEQYNEALKRTPELAFALMGMASAEVRRGNYAAARDLIGRAEHESFLAPECLQLRASLEFRESRRDPADMLRAALDLAPSRWPIRMRYLSALEQSGRRQQAARELRAFLEKEPFRADSWQLLGDLLADLHQPQLAIEAFRQAMRFDVHAGEARARIALIQRLAASAP
ncbi:MAG: Tetratricopeptide 2 repeat protein [Chthoniobacteraceae bacterium]|nr:Tetratricopeptide 2 repeat protein [Chthoniobacteraceae bacterium]